MGTDRDGTVCTMAKVELESYSGTFLAGIGLNYSTMLVCCGRFSGDLVTVHVQIEVSLKQGHCLRVCSDMV